MFDFLPFVRERGWTPIGAQEYAELWQRHGGSVATHPDFVQQLSGLADIPVRYLGWMEQEEPCAAVAVWGGHVALSRQYLKKKGKRRLFDLGNAEIIIPQAAGCKARFRFRGRYISALHEGRLQGVSLQQEQLAMAREPEEYSKKFRYNQRRELRLLEEAGAEILSVADLAPSEIAAIYQELFEKRWGFDVPGKQGLEQVFAALHEHMAGSWICLEGRPAAIQILYRVESPEWVSVEYVNGGVEPDFNSLSPGSVLSYVNTQNEWQRAREQGKTLRYSFGRADNGYKSRWCHEVPVLQVR